MLNLFVALLVNAFDFRETDNEPNDDTETADGPSKCSLGIRKAFQTRKSRLFVAKYREPFRLYELQVLESSRFSSKDTAGRLAICETADHREESMAEDVTFKGKPFTTYSTHFAGLRFSLL